MQVLVIDGWKENTEKTEKWDTKSFCKISDNGFSNEPDLLSD